MKLETAELLIFVARFLDYPDEEFFKERADLESYVKNMVSSPAYVEECLKRCRPLFELEQKELQELYVDTFDYREKTGLYLTAQELGDSRKRGLALIQLQKLISELGFERVGEELADYIPMLLELLAVAPLHEQTDVLKRRLAYAIHRIVGQIPNSNPYHDVLELLMLRVFEKPKLEEIRELENQWEEADLGPLPYPMLYQ